MTCTSNIILKAAHNLEGIVSISELMDKSGLSEKQVLNAATTLAKHGLLRRHGQGLYTITPAGKTAIAAAVEIKGGSKKGPRNKRTASPFRQQLWQVIRMEKKGTIGDFLALILEADDDQDRAYRAAHKYIKPLCHAGYMVILPVSRKRGGKTFNRYALAHDAGPHAPIIRKTGDELYDPNNGQTVSWKGGAA